MKNNISVIIPVYDLEKGNNRNYFTKLISSLGESVKEKPYISDITVVDDFPAANEFDFIKNTFKNNGIEHLLKFIKNEFNIGQAASRNKGLKFATGEYLHFIDQDDYIDASFYSKNDAFDKDIISMAPRIIVENTNKPLIPYKKRYENVFKAATEIKQLKIFLYANIAFSPGQYLIKRSFFNNINGFPVLNKKGADDFGLLVKAVIKKATFKFYSDVYFYYRVHSHQGQTFLNTAESRMEFYSQLNKANISLSLHFILLSRNTWLFGKLLTRFFFIFYFKRIR